MAGILRRRKEDRTSSIKLVRRFSSIKIDFEKERRMAIHRYQQQGLQVNVTTSIKFTDKKEIRKLLRASIERYSLPELYVKMICALFPQLKSREMPDSNALIQHLKRVFHLSDHEHSRLMDIARMTKLPQRIINLEIVEARDLPAKDTNGLSDPFCVVFVNSRDVAQRTKVIPETLTPVWKQYFTFKVNDVAKDILHIEVMDYNEQDEPLRDRIRRFKDIKSPGTLGILLKEIANARSPQELIGCLKIPVSDISSETIEKWFRLKNHGDRGDLYLRMALGYNKSKDTASEEFLQIVHFLLIHELDKDTALGTPFYWDENYEMWSKYILRQFKWQGGLKPKDIVLAKWRAYTVVNSIFPLNANMMCLLMDSVFERLLNGEYDNREIIRFWDCTVSVVDTIMGFIADIHDVLPCPVTVLHTYHMLKTLELLNQFLDRPSTFDRVPIPFTPQGIIQRVTDAVRNGANKFYLKVFADSTTTQITPIEDPLQLALERLTKMGQILEEDVRLGLKTVHTDFLGVLGVDFLRITYKVYDEQFGKMVKYIVDEYNGNLMSFNEYAQDDELDEESPSVKVGIAVLKLYCAVKTLASTAPPDYVTSETSEFSLKRGLHEWFFQSVATWIDIVRIKVINLVKSTIVHTECKTSDAPCRYSTKIDCKNGTDVPISPSATDTVALFVEMKRFWTSLGWPVPHQSFAIVRKILEELCTSLVYYSSKLSEAFQSQNLTPHNLQDDVEIHSYLRKASIQVNSINYVKEHVEMLSEQLDVTEILKSIQEESNTPGNTDEYEESIETIKLEMRGETGRIIGSIMDSCVKVSVPRFQHLLKEVVKCEAPKGIASHDSGLFRAVLEFTDNCLIVLKETLEHQTFRQILSKFWGDAVAGVRECVNVGIQSGKTMEYFSRLKTIMEQLYSLYWPRDSLTMIMEIRLENPNIFDDYNELMGRLHILEAPLAELKLNYYHQKFNRQQKTVINSSEHGVITIRVGFCESLSNLIVEILNARKLKAYNKNNLSDPYAKVQIVPTENFPTSNVFTSKRHIGTLYPLFEETCSFTLNKADCTKGYLKISIFDHDFLGRDRLMGEVFLPLTEVAEVSSVAEVQNLPQVHLSICKTDEADLEVLRNLNQRQWDKEAIRFVKLEKDGLK